MKQLSAKEKWQHTPIVCCAIQQTKWTDIQIKYSRKIKLSNRNQHRDTSKQAFTKKDKPIRIRFSRPN